MSAEQVQRDLNEIYRSLVRRYQAAFFGSRSKIAADASGASSIAASRDLQRPSEKGAEVAETDKRRLPKAA